MMLLGLGFFIMRGPGFSSRPVLFNTNITGGVNESRICNLKFSSCHIKEKEKGTGKINLT